MELSLRVDGAEKKPELHLVSLSLSLLLSQLRRAPSRLSLALVRRTRAALIGRGGGEATALRGYSSACRWRRGPSAPRALPFLTQVILFLLKLLLFLLLLFLHFQTGRRGLPPPSPFSGRLFVVEGGDDGIGLLLVVAAALPALAAARPQDAHAGAR